MKITTTCDQHFKVLANEDKLSIMTHHLWSDECRMHVVIAALLAGNDALKINKKLVSASVNQPTATSIAVLLPPPLLLNRHHHRS